MDELVSAINLDLGCCLSRVSVDCSAYAPASDAMISVAAGAVKQNWQALEFACEDLRLAPMTLKPYDIVWHLWLEKDGKGCKVNFCKLFCDTPSTGVTAKLCKKQLNKADTRKAKTGLAKFIVASGRTNVEANEFNKPGMNSYLEDALLDATSNYIQQLQLYMIFIYVCQIFCCWCFRLRRLESFEIC